MKATFRVVKKQIKKMMKLGMKGEVFHRNHFGAFPWTKDPFFWSIFDNVTSDEKYLKTVKDAHNFVHGDIYWIVEWIYSKLESNKVFNLADSNNHTTILTIIHNGLKNDFKNWDMDQSKNLLDALIVECKRQEWQKI